MTKKIALLLITIAVGALMLSTLSCQVQLASSTTTTTLPSSRPSVPVTSFLGVNLGDRYNQVEALYGVTQQDSYANGTILVYGTPTDSLNANFLIVTGEVMTIMSATGSHNLYGVTLGQTEGQVESIIGTDEVRISGSSYYFFNYPVINISVGFDNVTHRVAFFGIYDPAKVACPPEWHQRH